MAGISLLTSSTEAYADPVGNGTIGLNFDGATSVLAGQTVSGRIYSYDIGGTDAFRLSFDYDSSVFSGLQAVATNGTTILASEDTGSSFGVVFSVDPAIVDYSNLLTINITASADVGEGAVNLVGAEAAKQGGTVTLTIAGGTNTIGVRPGTIDEFTIESLSLAMTFFMVDTASPRWADAARFDLNNDGLIDIADFIKIAHAILDAVSSLKLKFKEDGTFKILQVSDYQDHLNVASHFGVVHPRTDELFQAMLDAEQPDVVIMTGDQIGGNMNGTQLQDYITQMMKPCEDREIPWFMTYGNHDEDATTALAEGWNKEKQLGYYRGFSHNINRVSMSNCVETYADGYGTHTDCVGDMYALVYDADGKTPIYNLWGLDSNRYERNGVKCPKLYQKITQNGGWDYIRPKQVEWYVRTSEQLEARYGKLNSLMFFHIPLMEWSNMVIEHATFGAAGLRGEGECPGNINTGLFGAAFQRGDVKGMFVGHDHINDYIGTYYGIQLAYDASIGYQTYGGEMKGGRVIELDKNDLSVFATRMIYAQDYNLGTPFSQRTVAESVAAAGF
jgi:hypothetical protein